ncbi:hypothetical protein DCS_07813 [Drechmeria coniospora]|uniref:Anaphase-promoting complex subunit 4 n=1 Tax=Drechmeria coniospora TaxID=98403 RepID=A0A151GFH9_DRECN|nr:hypothetical protein DCS_07813 [Drechmeria coniospora]KYK55848.1 hypothetical protein DCS_07813 [Drechmeria coniospora]
MAQVKQLTLLSETEFDSKAPNGFPASCPKLDLATVWDTGGRNLLIYRPPNQVISKIHHVGAPGKPAPEAVAVTWKPDGSWHPFGTPKPNPPVTSCSRSQQLCTGQFLAVGWSDGVVRLMGLENNKAAHHIPVCDPSNTRITYIGWTSSSIADKAVKSISRQPGGDLFDAWSCSSRDMPMDLPQELAFLEVETALPKISALPTASAGTDEDAVVFTLRTGIEFLFPPPKRNEYDDVNVMVTGTSDGRLLLNIFDTFGVGIFQCPSANPPAIAQLICHASHPQVSTQALVLADKISQPLELHLVPMDLPFIYSSPINLSLLFSKLTTLQTMLRYLRQTQMHMIVEWKNARELPSRFLRSVHESLENAPKGPRGIVPALYHTVVTGHAHQSVREWLLDSLAERGHKRWDKAVVSSLENLRDLVHENFLPSLERFAIILSRLRGLAQFHNSRSDIGFSVAQITRVLDIISCLTLVGHKILTYVMDELESFTAFSTWLRLQIDRLASSSGGELNEKEATIDCTKVIAYIERYLTGSPLDVFFDEVSENDYAEGWKHCDDGFDLLDMLNEQLNKCEEGQPSMRALYHVKFLVDCVTKWSNRIFQDIANAKKRSVRFGKPIRLSVGHAVSMMDVRMCQTENGGMIYAALTSKEADSKVFLFLSDLDVINGISTNHPVRWSGIDLAGRKLIDLKFLNDTTLVLVCNEPDDTPVVLAVPIRADDVPYELYDGHINAAVSSVSTQGLTEYRLPGGHSIKPVRMEVHDMGDVKGTATAKLCLLGSNRTTWYTLLMPLL